MTRVPALLIAVALLALLLLGAWIAHSTGPWDTQFELQDSGDF